MESDVEPIFAGDSEMARRISQLDWVKPADPATLRGVLSRARTALA